MRKKVRKAWACLLTAAMVLSLVCGSGFSAAAEEAETPAAEVEVASETPAAEEIASITAEPAPGETAGAQEPMTMASVPDTQSAGTEGATEQATAAAEESAAQTEVNSEEETAAPTEGTSETETAAPTEVNSEEETAALTETNSEEETAASTETNSEEETTVPTETNSEEETTAPTEINSEEETAAQTEIPGETETGSETETETSSETETNTETETEPESETQDPEEILSYTAQVDGVTVTASAKRSALPENAVLTVTRLSNTDAEVASALEAGGVAYDGFVAVDVSFTVDGAEIEPDGEVSVSMQVSSGLLPEEADADTLQVQHLDESSGAVDVQTVADTAAVSEGTIEQTDAAVTAEFAVDSFSTFTITWQNSSSGALTAYCYYTDGTTASQQITTDENILDATAVESLAPSVNNGTYVKAVIASTYDRSPATSTITVTHIRKQNNTWQYSTDGGTTWTSKQTNQALYFLYSKTATGSSGTITFAYYAKDEINDEYSIASRDTVKFTISLVDENGNNETYDLPAGSVVPDSFTFSSSEVSMSAASFAQMGITIPGYTYEGGYAYFYWSGNFLGTKFSVSDFKNFGAKSSNYTNYDSYIGYTGSMPGGSSIAYRDYNQEDFGEAGYNYWAYNPTGTLRIVFVKVSEKTAYKSNFVDAYKVSTYRQIDTKDMSMTQEGSSSTFYGMLKEVTSEVPVKDGYDFLGWYTDKDADGNGTGTKIETPSDDTTHYYADTYYYAKWARKTVEVTVTKTVTGNMGVTGQSFAFTYTANQTEDGTTAGANFDLKSGETTTIRVPYGSSLTVTETDSGDGYQTSVTAKKSDGADVSVTSADSGRTATVTVTEPLTISYTNEKTVVPPTGLGSQTSATLAILVLVTVIGLAAVILTGRRRQYR